MSLLHDFQERMRDQALYGGDRGRLVDALKKDDNAFSPEERLDIYRNNTLLGLTDALAAAYPVVRRLVGEDFFAMLALAFIRAHPPKRAPMLAYGAEMPEFIGGYGPAAGLPYLADLARLEAAWNYSYHAEEAEPLPPESLREVPQERLGEVRLGLHPSLRFVASEYPILDIWQANQGEAPPNQPISLDAGAQWLIVHRPEAEVFVRRLSGAAFSFLMAVGVGQTLQTAWDAAHRLDPDTIMTEEFAALLAGGAFVTTLGSEGPSFRPRDHLIPVSDR